MGSVLVHDIRGSHHRGQSVRVRFEHQQVQAGLRAGRRVEETQQIDENCVQS